MRNCMWRRNTCVYVEYGSNRVHILHCNFPLVVLPYSLLEEYCWLNFETKIANKPPYNSSNDTKKWGKERKIKHSKKCCQFSQNLSNTPIFLLQPTFVFLSFRYIPIYPIFIKPFIFPPVIPLVCLCYSILMACFH